MTGPWLLDDMRESGRRQASARAELVSGGRSSGGTTVGLLLGFEGLTVSTGDEVSTVEVRRAHVDIAGEEMWLSANPGGYVIGGTVTVQIDGTRRPLYVLGPRSTAPVAGVEVPGAGETVTHLPDLVMDEEARRRNAEVAAETEAAQRRIASAQDLIDSLRDRVGRKAWTGETHTSPGGTFRWTPLGGGKVRFQSLHPEGLTGWQWHGTDLPPSTDPDVTVVLPAGAVEVEHDHPDHFEQSFITVTAEMLDPDYGWTDIEWPDVSLEDITFPPEISAALAELWEPLISGGLIVATEAIIGPHLISTGAIEGRHLNVVETAPGGARFSAQPDGIRMWQAGNSGPHPNLTVTTGDGFRIQDNDGHGLLWIDPATGDLRTAAGVWAGTFRTGGSGQAGLIIAKNANGWDFLQFSPNGASSEENAGILSGFEWDEVRQWEPVIKARGPLADPGALRQIRIDGALTGMPAGPIFSSGPWRINANGTATFVDVEVPRVGLGTDNTSVFFQRTGAGVGQVRIPSLNVNPTTSAANVYVSGTGVLGVSTSARKYKADIQPAPERWAERILDLDPQTWIDKAEADRATDGEDLRRVPGLVAEDVRDAGLDAYVTYDDDGDVQGLSYDRLWTLLIPLVREQRDQIARQQQQIDALTERLNRLDPEGA